jgi:hypothetical protein
MTIEWKGLPHGEFTAVLAAGLEERDRRIKELELLTQPKLGRPRKGNGTEFPDTARGALDTAGEA